jgi:hypothetical protein
MLVLAGSACRIRTDPPQLLQLDILKEKDIEAQIMRMQGRGFEGSSIKGIEK